MSCRSKLHPGSHAWMNEDGRYHDNAGKILQRKIPALYLIIQRVVQAVLGKGSVDTSRSQHFGTSRTV